MIERGGTMIEKRRHERHQSLNKDEMNMERWHTYGCMLVQICTCLFTYILLWCKCMHVCMDVSMYEYPSEHLYWMKTPPPSLLLVEMCEKANATNQKAATKATQNNYKTITTRDTKRPIARTNQTPETDRHEELLLTDKVKSPVRIVVVNWTWMRALFALPLIAAQNVGLIISH